LLSQEQDTDRRAAINEMIAYCRQQMVEIDQIKETETCTMLTSLGCRFGIVKAVQGQIHDFKIWYKRDLEIAQEEANEAAARSLAQLADQDDLDDEFFDD
jgi:2-C-methyl-D-erythritol 4-phosphate cytidylyltransferase